MNRIEPTTEDIKKPEVQENHEALRSVENPEELRQQMTSEAEKETSQFKQECADGLSRFEVRAEKDGLMIDNEDSEQLRGVAAEADNAKAELETALIPPQFPEETIAKKEEGEKASFCHDCGKPTRKGAKFCVECGAKLMQKDSSGTWNSNENVPPPEEYFKSVPPLFPKDTAIETTTLEQKNKFAMKERVMEDPKLLNAKEASKKLLAKERIKLAQEIRNERRVSRENIKLLKARVDFISVSPENFENGHGDEQYGKFSEMQSGEASEIAERLHSGSEMNGEDVSEEQENLSQLISNSESLETIKQKLEKHYARANVVAKERFDTLNRSLEYVMQRNNAFIVHKLADMEGVRHNSNSNVLSEATYEDDIDIMLSLEPSISASSVIPGEKRDLWPGASGFLLGGGQIGEAGGMDQGTHSIGIKERRSAGGEKASIEKIDKIVGKRGGEEMNELVVNNAEVFGFFQNAEMDGDGKFWMYDLDIKEQSARATEEQEKGTFYSKAPGSFTRMLTESVKEYRKRFSVASERGIPLYIMTGDRNVHEYLGVNDDGSIEVGKQINPEDVANGRAGLPPEKRKEIGEKLLEKKIFREQETHEEAQGIIDSL